VHSQILINLTIKILALNKQARNLMHTLTTLIISSLSLFIVRIAMMPSPAAATAVADSLEPTDYNKIHRK